MTYTKFKTNKNLPFTEKTKMADVILSDVGLIPVISRFNVEYGFGNKTVGEVCEIHGINQWFFLEIINSFHNHDYFSKEQLQKFSSVLIVEYLSNAHVYYRNVKLPEIKGLIEEMKRQLTEQNQKNVELLGDFFNSYRTELERHFKVEEQDLFPYAIALDEAVESGKYQKELVQAVLNEPIEQFETIHASMEVTLSDLKNLIIRHMPPVVCSTLCQRLLTELFKFEEDLDDHARIEEKVLVPKLKMLEKIILSDGQ